MAAMLFDPTHHNSFFDTKLQKRLKALTYLLSGVQSSEQISRGDLKAVEILVTGWGAPGLSRELLKELPRLRFVLHLGGSVKGLVADGALFAQGIRLSSTNGILAQSVAEFCFAQIILTSRRVHENSRYMCQHHAFPEPRFSPTSFPPKIGLIGYGAIGRSLRQLLRHIPSRVIVHDPYVSPADAKRDGVELITLMELFAQADIVSCHLPHLPATESMLKRPHFAAMKPGAVFLNTARGQVVDEADLIEVLADRPDLHAILDVVATEPIAHDHPFHEMGNVTLTPHIAGCLGAECQRFGQFAVEEIGRWIEGNPLGREITAKQLSIRA